MHFTCTMVIIAVCASCITGAGTPVSGQGHVVAYGQKFMWEETQQAIVPNYAMLGTNDGPLLDEWDETKFDAFLDDLMGKCGFTGVHIPVYGQWLEIGQRSVSSSKTTPDSRTFDKLEMMIKKVYARGGATHIWMWGDKERGWSSANLSGGVMGSVEKAICDEINRRLAPLPGWTIGYGFDLWEWVNGSQIDQWYSYMQGKSGWKIMMGARGSKNSYTTPGSKWNYASWEWHQPNYDEYIRHLNNAQGRPSASDDRFRVRGRDKDVTAEQTRQMLWWATLAGGVGGIWGYLGSESGISRIYPNADQLLCYSKFFNAGKRFRRDMVRDNSITDGRALRDGHTHYVIHKENTSSVKVDLSKFTGTLTVVAVDAKNAYKEIVITLTKSSQTWTAPNISDWALAVGDFGGGVTAALPAAAQQGLSHTPAVSVNAKNGEMRISIQGIGTHQARIYNMRGAVVARFDGTGYANYRPSLCKGTYLLDVSIDQAGARVKETIILR